MEPQYVFSKEVNLDSKSRFLLGLTDSNSVEKLKFSLRRKYLITNFKVNAKIKTDITKQNNYNKIHKVSEFCGELREKTNEIIPNLILDRKEIDKLENEFISREY